jgi:hypothetical protein
MSAMNTKPNPNPTPNPPKKTEAEIEAEFRVATLSSGFTAGVVTKGQPMSLGPNSKKTKKPGGIF